LLNVITTTLNIQQNVLIENILLNYVVYIVL